MTGLNAAGDKTRFRVFAVEGPRTWKYFRRDAKIPLAPGNRPTLFDEFLFQGCDLLPAELFAEARI